ncbi:hypothetical protein HZC53_00825 [Candidatus Uhrbacteria bacterium]|nr:hypothetical protein [Candidatus Uhrbacteria bacterium]
MKSSRSRQVGRSRRLTQFDNDHAPVQTDWKFWALHALHWHALLLAVVTILYMGYTGFGNW